MWFIEMPRAYTRVYGDVVEICEEERGNFNGN